ncbi:MAG: tetratricopeptide repeat protein [Bacteroidetes bacterium]|nr:tetratricopeptide repeat protein [Bacteroidota bacterium]
MFKKSFQFLLLFFACTLHAQQAGLIDSLRRVLKNTTSDTARCNTFNHLIDVVGEKNEQARLNEQYKQYSQASLKKTKESDPLYKFFSRHLANAFNNSAVLANQDGNYEKALGDNNTGLKIRQDIHDLDGVSQSLNNIGFIYFEHGNIAKAFEYLEKSLKIRLQLKDKRTIAEAYNNMAGLYDSQGDTARAHELFEKSLQIRREIKDKTGLASSLSNLAAFYDDQGNTVKALEYYKESLLINEQLNNKSIIATVYNNVGQIYLHKPDFDSAMTYFQRSYSIYNQLQNNEGMAYSLQNLASLMYYKKDYSKVIEYGEQSLKISQALGFPELIGASTSLLSRVYKKLNKPARALEMYELFIRMRDSLSNKANREAALRAQFQYDFEKKEVIIKEKQEQERILAYEKNSRMKIIIGFVIGGLLLVVIFSISIYNRLKITQKQKTIIEEQKQLVDEHQKEILDSINYAKRLQEAIFPPLEEIKKYLPEHFILYLPKDIVAGDFYWFEQKDDHVFIAAADCTGHGVPGALVSVVCSNALNRTVLEFGLTDPGQILDKTRELVVSTFAKSGDNNVKDGMDISLCCIHTKTNEVLWAGANNPLWYLQNNILCEIKADKQPIGKTENAKPFTTHRVQLNKNDQLYIFTDGFSDQFGGPKGKKFKYKQLNDILVSSAQKQMSQQKEILHSAFIEWKGKLEQVDDVCVIGIKIH